MRDNFPKAFDLTVMRFEGGSRMTNDPDDPGGLTKYGLSKRANPDLDIATLTEAQAKEVYLERYWLKAGCDDMPYPWDMIQFDAAVNVGINQARDFKEMASDPASCLMNRIFFYKTLCDKKPNMQKYFRGWVNRVIDLWIEVK